MFKHILVAVDGSPNAERAIDCAAEMASKYDAVLTLFHVMKRAGSDRIPDDLSMLAQVEHIDVTEADMLRGTAEGILASASKQAQIHGAKTIETSTEQGDPAKSIIEHCKASDVDLIVMGRRGLGTLASLAMGSVSNKVAHSVDIACMTVP